VRGKSPSFISNRIVRVKKLKLSTGSIDLRGQPFLDRSETFFIESWGYMQGGGIESNLGALGRTKGSCFEKILT